MITQIDLGLFKCFELLKLPLADLTLLSGSNASGKSSILQALVLLHQTMRKHEWSTRLMLNGDAVKLGTVTDVIDHNYGRNTFTIALTSDGQFCRWSFSGDRGEMSLTVDSVQIGDTINHLPSKLHYLYPPEQNNNIPILVQRLRDLIYLTAERIGPREFYPLEDPQIATTVGPKGEYAVCLLHLGRDEGVLNDLVVEGIPPTRLNQVMAHMQKFFPGCRLKTTSVMEANAVTLGLSTSADAKLHRPIHEGFGLTQVLPIIVAALSAKKGDLLLIENPEVHLHPSGQGRMGQFLAEVSRAGVQVIIETHSDHILNGVRKAVKRKLLRPDQVAIHFFQPRTENKTQAYSPQLNESGNIDSWPDGFFDQFDKDMNHFAGWGE